MSQTLEVIPAQTMAVAPRSQFAINDFSALMELAVKQGTGVKELLEMRDQLRREYAKEQFDLAMAAFQAECPTIHKQKAVQSGGKTLYSYSPLEDVIQQIKPLLQKHGFSYTLDTDTASEAGWVVSKVHVTHAAGHTCTSVGKFPLGKGTSLMSETQVYASALTFAARRVFCGAFGIVTAGEDMDGRIKQKPQGPSKVAGESEVKDLARTLWELLKSVRGTEQNWNKANQYLIDECFLNPDEAAPQLTKARFITVINAVKAKQQ